MAMGAQTLAPRTHAPVIFVISLAILASKIDRIPVSAT
jgi:hypothetical protein